MKKFNFPLNTVLEYKQQVLESLQGEHAAILAQLREQEAVLESIWNRYRAYNEEFKEEQRVGLPITQALMYQTGLRTLENNIARETERLEEFHQQEERKRQQVVEARKDTASIEKLKEKQLKLYQKEMEKDAEALIDEFVSAARAGGLNDYMSEPVDGDVPPFGK